MNNPVIFRRDGIHRLWYRIFRFLYKRECMDCGFPHKYENGNWVITHRKPY